MGDSEFSQDRENMVRYQLSRRGIHDARVIEAMRNLPRHLFVPERLRDMAYQDRPLDIGQGQTISQPYMVALMTQLLELTPEDRVLEVGAGSGYQSAILGYLASEVYTIERIPELADQARKRLEEAAIPNVTVLVGDGTLGHESAAPYDAILVTAAAPSIPSALKQQLAQDGRLVCPVGERGEQILVRIRRKGEEFPIERHTPCMFVPLIGAEGWGN